MSVVKTFGTASKYDRSWAESGQAVLAATGA